MTGHAERISRALDDIKTWLRAHGGDEIVENLAPGCSEYDLTRTEEALGFGLPVELRELWLRHNGQCQEACSFFPYLPYLDLLSVEEAAAAHRVVLDLYITGGMNILGDPDILDEPLLPEEMTTHWLPVAREGFHFLLVQADTGRVFEAYKDGPSLVADNIATLLEDYSGQLQAGNYVVDEDGSLTTPDDCSSDAPLTDERSPEQLWREGLHSEAISRYSVLNGVGIAEAMKALRTLEE
ncbi:MAG: SMI1/KNR4 family protein [Polyangiaceae bacterium]